MRDLTGHYKKDSGPQCTRIHVRASLTVHGPPCASAGDDRTPIRRRDPTSEPEHASGSRGWSNAMASPRRSRELSSVAAVAHQNTEPIIPMPAHVITLCGVVHIRVNTAFENMLPYVRISQGKHKNKTNFEIFRFGVWFTQEVRQMDVKECRDMTSVEQKNVLQTDRFFE